MKNLHHILLSKSKRKKGWLLKIQRRMFWEVLQPTILLGLWGRENTKQLNLHLLWNLIRVLGKEEQLHWCQNALFQSYLSVPTRTKVLNWFGKAEGTFLLTFGGDGCPFGKNENACFFLLSLLTQVKALLQVVIIFLFLELTE